MEWKKQSLEESPKIKKEQSSLKFWQNRLGARTFDGKLKYLICTMLKVRTLDEKHICDHQRQF